MDGMDDHWKKYECFIFSLSEGGGAKGILDAKDWVILVSVPAAVCDPPPLATSFALALLSHSPVVPSIPSLLPVNR